jgi:hypothetical protein
VTVFRNSILGSSLDRRGVLAALFAALPGAGLLVAAKQWTTLRILVRDEQGRPVPRASVIVRELKGKKKKLKRKSPAYELKTSNEGSTPVPPLPRGPILIQVISKGYQTHGEEVALTEPEQTETIVLKPPSDQVSVHKE